MILKAQEPHIVTRPKKLGKAARGFFGPSPSAPLLPLGTGTENMGTAGSHLWQLRDLNQPLEVLQVAGAVEEILEPARGREWLETAPVQPLAWLQGVSPGHRTALEGKVFCAATNSGQVLGVPTASLPLLESLSHKAQA